MPGRIGFDLNWDEATLRNFLHDPAGPVGVEVLTAAGRVVERGARSRAPINTGRLYDSVKAHPPALDGAGLYVDVSARFYARFLDKPAKQIRKPNRFLRTALRDIRATHLGSY